MLLRRVRRGYNCEKWWPYPAAILLGLLFWTCEVSGPLPVFIQIEEFDLTVQPGQGSASERITEGWFFANGEFLGAYSLPAEVPLVAEGSTSIRIAPGIKVNGIISTPDLYTFYEDFRTEVDVTPGDRITIQPETFYTDFSVFAFAEDFETSNAFQDDLDGNIETRVESIEGDDVFEGTRSGYIRLTSDNPVIEVASLPILGNIPVNGSDVFLEFDYKNNVEFGIGLTGSGPGVPQSSITILVLREQAEWNKMYLELSLDLRASQLPGYQIYIAAAHASDQSVSEIFLDNFKLIHIDQ